MRRPQISPRPKEEEGRTDVVDEERIRGAREDNVYRRPQHSLGVFNHLVLTAVQENGQKWLLSADGRRKQADWMVPEGE